MIIVILPKVWELICNPSTFSFFFSWRSQKLAADGIFRLYFFLSTFSKASAIVFFPLLKHTCSSKDKSKAEVLHLNGFLHSFLFYSSFYLYILSLTKTEMNGITFWKGMRNRCKHACIGQGILWNLFNWKSRFRKTFDAGSFLNCYQQAQQDNSSTSYINRQISVPHK